MLRKRVSVMTNHFQWSKQICQRPTMVMNSSDVRRAGRCGESCIIDRRMICYLVNFSKGNNYLIIRAITVVVSEANDIQNVGCCSTLLVASCSRIRFRVGAT